MAKISGRLLWFQRRDLDGRPFVWWEVICWRKSVARSDNWQKTLKTSAALGPHLITPNCHGTAEEWCGYSPSRRIQNFWCVYLILERRAEWSTRSYLVFEGACVCVDSALFSTLGMFSGLLWVQNSKEPPPPKGLCPLLTIVVQERRRGGGGVDA